MKRKTENRILNISTAIAMVLFWLSVLSIDSDTWLPIIVCVVCWIYLAWVAWRKGWLYDPEMEDDR